MGGLNECKGMEEIGFIIKNIEIPNLSWRTEYLTNKKLSSKLCSLRVCNSFESSILCPCPILFRSGNLEGQAKVISEMLKEQFSFLTFIIHKYQLKKE